MNKNKTISSSIILLFFIIISYFYGGEFLEYHKSNFDLKRINEQTKESAESFNLSNLKEISGVDFYYSPSTELRDKIIEDINNAEEYIYLEIYMFTEKNIKNSIKKAYERGVDVKIILEKDPYMAYSINDSFYEELLKKGIDIVWSNDENYALNHSKIMIIDGESMISTGNFTYSTFTKNRDLFLFIKDEKINKSLLEIFKDDYKGINKTIYNENLLISPFYSREKISTLLDSAKSDIKIYIQYFNDDSIRNQIIKIKENNDINITAIIPETAEEDEETKELIKNGINIKVLEKYKMHSKAILIDDEVLFIGSINFSGYSLDKNREVGVLLKNKQTINQFLELFYIDFNN